MGWYGGAGARLMQAPVTLNGVQQPACPVVEAVTSLLECNWSLSHTLSVPATPTDPASTGYWASGTYLVKLTGSSGKQNFVIFTLRDDNRYSNILFQNAVTTYQAYNNWGGKSLYGFNSSANVAGGPGIAAYKVSFNRPYVGLGGQFLLFELKTVRFLEREGYDVSYSTDIDVHTSGAQQLLSAKHKSFMIAGHDEYWTKQMRDNVEAARNQGMNLIFLGANTSYWQIRLDPAFANASQSQRTLVSYKDKLVDPFASIDPTQLTLKFRDPEINRPEAALVGAMYDFSPVSADMVMANCLTWVCAGTSLQAGSVLTKLLGYEVDILDASTPPGTVELARSPYLVGTAPNQTTRFSSMTYYTHSSGAQVFSTGSMNWNLGLDALGNNPELLNPDAQQVTRNVLNLLAAPPPVVQARATALRAALAKPETNQKRDRQTR